MATFTGRYGVSKTKLNCKCTGDICKCTAYFDGKRKGKLKLSKSSYEVCSDRGGKTASCMLDKGSMNYYGPKMY